MTDINYGELLQEFNDLIELRENGEWWSSDFVDFVTENEDALREVLQLAAAMEKVPVSEAVIIGRLKKGGWAVKHGNNEWREAETPAAAIEAAIKALLQDRSEK